MTVDVRPGTEVPAGTLDAEPAAAPGRARAGPAGSMWCWPWAC